MENRWLRDFNLPPDHDEATWGAIRRFWWNPSIEEPDGRPQLYAGDQLVATFDSMAELRVFVSGMATALLALPPEVTARLAEVLGVEPEWEDRPDWWDEADLP